MPGCTWCQLNQNPCGWNPAINCFIVVVVVVYFNSPNNSYVQPTLKTGDERLASQLWMCLSDNSVIPAQSSDRISMHPAWLQTGFWGSTPCVPVRDQLPLFLSDSKKRRELLVMFRLFLKLSKAQLWKWNIVTSKKLTLLHVGHHPEA